MSSALISNPTNSPTSSRLVDYRKILSQNIRVNNTGDSDFPPGRQRTRAQTAAYLLSTRKELPDIDNEAMNRMRAVQNFYENPAIMMDDQPIELTAQCYNHDKTDSLAGLKKIEFRVLLHTTDSSRCTTYVDRLFSESDFRVDIFDAVSATMDVPKMYQHLGWRLSTARRSDPPHRLLTPDDIDSAFKAARAEQSSGRGKKKVVIDILNTSATFESSAGEESLPSLLPYTKELKNVKNKLLCSEHGDNTFCWVDATQPTTLHYPLCTQDLQEWAKYLHDTHDPDNPCITPPKSLYFDEIRKTRKERSTITSSLQRVPTKLVSPVIHNHIHLAPAADDTTISDGALTRQQGNGAAMPSRPLKRTYALYMESDEESDDDEPPQSIEDVLASIHSRYPALNFPEYIGKMKDHGIFYLPTAAHFDIIFYEENIGMTAGAAYTFQMCVSRAYMQAEHLKGRSKAKGKKKA
ncbi:uncharacterized protein F5891DRAFT_1193680 [Suillus fuscotomentosus]|uniref:Uncharacterized protein n=1 Tax=Suillus fuscotomentosus TaxID=1912939 RepID=A0AAD4DXD4_9AGAM|nr:uncharacterized protein F5891DRAFT_1193680 [Suillus fuscotomentosus]KAG1895866.1 hypothetical protein F5891DRAFT_1193680 [Suillus fuscotomentosus]